MGDAFAGDIIQVLVDPYPQVRVAAIHALERLRPDGAWRKELKFECYVPAGEFVMGDEENHDNERPNHIVYLDPYYVSKYLVTNAEYRRYAQDRGYPFEVPFGKENHPVVVVSWFDALDYAAWAGMRLLTEAEWEKAASWEPEAWSTIQPYLLTGSREGSVTGVHGRKRAYPWGDMFDARKCNTSVSGLRNTTSVGAYSAEGGDSSCGAADMGGNVFEWCFDWYGAVFYHHSPSRNPKGPTSGDLRVLRGGSFVSGEWCARCSFRNGYSPEARDIDLGFRLGVSPGL